MTQEEIEKKAEEYGSQGVWQDRKSFEDGAKWANAEWHEKVRWKDARKEPATKFNKWIEFSSGKGIDNHRFIVFIESKTHFKFYFKYHPNELLWREIIE